jgi:manganese-dependent inorganic pyrophosphatase
MFDATSDVGDIPAEELVRRDAKEYQVRPGRNLCIAQIETVGLALLERRLELLDAMERARRIGGYVLYALMLTDIVQRRTALLVAGDPNPVARALEVEATDHVLDLPGVMSRKKQVVPRLLAAL